MAGQYARGRARGFRLLLRLVNVVALVLASVFWIGSGTSDASHSQGRAIDDDCSVPSNSPTYFWRAGPASDWFKVGSTPICHWKTNSSSSRSNYANMYLDPNVDRSGYYRFDTFIPAGYTGRARYNRYKTGTAGGITSSYYKTQSSYSNQWVTVTSKSYFCENVNTPCAGYMQFADNGGTPMGTLAIDISAYYAVH